MATNLYINESASDPGQALVAGFFGTQPAPALVLAQGDQARSVNLHFLGENPNSADPTQPYVYNTPPATVSLAVGTIDALPTGGTWTFTESAAAQTTGALAYNITAAALQTAIRAGCSTNLGSCTVSGSGITADPFIIDRVTVGTLANATTTGSALTPDGSAAEVLSYDGTAALSKKFQVTLNRAPAVLATTWTANTPTAAAITTTTGGSAGVNEVQRLTIQSDAYGGSVALNLSVPHGPVAVQSSSVANPTSIASTGHGLVTGDSIVMLDNGSTPSIAGTHTVTRVNDNSFTIPVNVIAAGTTSTFTAPALLRSLGPIRPGISAEDVTTILESHSSSLATAGSFAVVKSASGSSLLYDITFTGALGSTNITAMTVTDGLLYPSYLAGSLNCRTVGVLGLLAGSTAPVTTGMEIQKTVAGNATMSAFRDDVTIRPKFISQ